MAAHAVGAAITTSEDHGFETGDFVTCESSGEADEQIVGLEFRRTYRVMLTIPTLHLQI